MISGFSRRRQQPRVGARSDGAPGVDAVVIGEARSEVLGGSVFGAAAGLVDDGVAAMGVGGRGRYRTADRWCVKPELYH